jgi:hypothetical protein
MPKEKAKTEQAAKMNLDIVSAPSSHEPADESFTLVQAIGMDSETTCTAPASGR